MDGRCLDDAAERAFGSEPTPARPRRRRFRRKPRRRFVSVDPDRAPDRVGSAADEAPATPETPQP